MKIELTKEQMEILDKCTQHVNDPKAAIQNCMNEFIEKSHPSIMDKLPICIARMKDFIELAETGTAQTIAWRSTEIAIDLLILAQEYNNQKNQIETSGKLKGAQIIIGMTSFN
jgi:hypothetical protein